MFNSRSTFTLVSALVGAGAYAQPLPAAAHGPVPMQAVENIQRARVAIYCGNAQEAVADIRAAGRQLRASGAEVSRETLAGLEEAAWMARRNQHVLAEQSLDAVLRLIVVDAGRS